MAKKKKKKYAQGKKRPRPSSGGFGSAGLVGQLQAYHGALATRASALQCEMDGIAAAIAQLNAILAELQE